MQDYHFTYQGEKMRLDKYLVSVLPSFTRSQIQVLIEEGNVTVNMSPKKANYLLRAEDLVELQTFPPKKSELCANDIPLDIIYEDSDLIVVNKPQGMVVHPAVGNKENTLVNALLHHCTDLSGINGQLRAGIVHRLDKDTSGLLVACKNDFTHKNLSKQFEKRLVKREYYALVNGVIPHNFGKINAPIARNKIKRQQMEVNETGREAITNFQVIERFLHHTLIKVQLETGRTHQIRVHMLYIGYPVYQDPVYGPKKEANKQYLHAKTLGFVHPRDGKPYLFDSPLPAYFQDKLNELK